MGKQGTKIKYIKSETLTDLFDPLHHKWKKALHGGQWPPLLKER